MQKKNLLLIIVLAILVCPVLSFSQISFIEHQIANLDPGTESHNIACADVNSDGVEDLIHIDRSENDIYWWERQDDGNWVQHLVSTTVMAPVHACGADFDMDGDIDIAIATISGLNQLYFIRQDADSWTEFVFSSDFHAPTCISAVDMDNDGDMDILSSSHNDDKVSWWEFESDEVWIEHIVATGLTTPFEAVAADIDNDGDMDVVLATGWEDSIIWWENENDDNWTQHYIDSNVDHPSLIEIEDIDNDGDLDVLSFSGDDYYYAWWEQTDSGTWVQHNILENIGSGLIYLEAADIDDDGDIDFLSNYGQALHIFEMTQPESWVNSVLYNSNNYKPLIADIDNDTDLDIYVLGRNEDYLFWFEQDGSPVEPSPFSLLSPANQDTVWLDEVTLSWEESVNPDNGEEANYDVWVGTDSDMSNNTLVADSISENSLILENIEDDLTYFWTVRATDDNSGGRWADEVFSFQTYFPEAPLPFELQSPADAEVVADESAFPLTFNWIGTTDPDPNDEINYILEISSDENFSNPLMFDAGSNTQFDVESLEIADYWWRVCAIDLYDNQTYSSEVRTLLVTLDVESDTSQLPSEFTVSNAYPNPFNPSVSVDYSVPQKGTVNFVIFNIQGQTVYKKSIIQDSGYHRFNFNKTDSGIELVSGIYFIKLQFQDKIELRKVMLLK